jgi:hypothetical protein
MNHMPEPRIPAGNFQIGDHVHLDDGRTVEIRDIERGDQGLLLVNPGAEDQLDGHAWEWATVTRNA